MTQKAQKKAWIVNQKYTKTQKVHKKSKSGSSSCTPLMGQNNRHSKWTEVHKSAQKVRKKLPTPKIVKRPKRAKKCTFKHNPKTCILGTTNISITSAEYDWK